MVCLVTVAAYGQQLPQILTLNTISVCQGSAIDIPFGTTGIYSTGNVFTAQLSNASGSFNSPVSLGTLSGSSGGTISGLISATQSAGSGYKIRVVSSAPVLTGPEYPANIVVLSKPTAAQILISPTGSPTICQGGSIALSVPANAGFAYQWYKDNQPIAGATTDILNAGAAGAYYAEVFNSSGCSRSSGVKNVIVNTVPANITPGGVQTICAGQSLSLQANTGSGLTYQWLLGGIPISGATTSAYQASMAGNYSVLVTNSLSCSSESGALTLNVANCGPAVTSISSPSMCQGSTVDVVFNIATTYNAGNVFTAQLSNATGSFASPITIGTLASTTGGTINTTIPASQTAGSGYRIRILSSNPASTGGDNGSDLIVSLKPTAAQATITNAGTISICPGSFATLNAAPTPGFGYQWFLNNSPISGATTSNCSASAAGTYYVVVTNSSGCSRPSGTKAVTQLPAPPATISPASQQTICAGQSVSFQANTGTGLSYQWFLNGLAIPGATNSNYTSVTAGNHLVEVTNSNGCTVASSSTNVTLIGCGAVISDTGTRRVCQGGAITVNFGGPVFNAGNIFTLQLSDATGGFANPQNLATLTGIGNGTISANIPQGTPAGINYKLRVTSTSPITNGITSSLTIRVQELIADTPSLCAVSVEPSSGKNQLVWNKAPSTNIDSFIIYRITASSGQYQRIGAQPYGSYSTFLDNTADPLVQAQRYYITAKNNCGETPAGTKHRTMHLSISKGQDANTWNLIWNGYSGFAHTSYNIWRGSSAANMQLIASIEANSFNSFTDLAAPSGTLYYMISVADAPSCNPTARTTGNFLISSNISSNNRMLGRTDVSVFPNPCAGEGRLTITAGSEDSYQVIVRDILGRTVETLQAETGKETIFGRNLVSGIYAIEVLGTDNSVVAKWIKQ